MLSKKGKNTLAARAGEAILQQLPVEEKTLRRVTWLMEPKHLKLLGVTAAAGTAAFSVIGGMSRMSAYRMAMARELKKQLEPVNRKLNELEKQNEELKQQNEQLRKQLQNISK